jgi:purine-nucleoside phosphorylase
VARYGNNRGFAPASGPARRQQALALADMSARVGATWTTDAPFRETREAIAAALAVRIFAVEMEAAALYAFAVARQKQVLLPRTCHQSNGECRR